MTMSPGSPMHLRIEIERWPLKSPFRITGHIFVETEVIVVRLEREGRFGRGEAAGVYYLNENVDSMVKSLESIRARIERGMDREEVQQVLPRGGARNALDCALWDLEARESGLPVWQLAGLSRPRPLLTTMTIGADSPAAMAAMSQNYADARALKLKLLGDGEDANRVRAVRRARPDVWLAVDANQGLTRATLDGLMSTLIETDVKLLEQPFPVGTESQLDGLDSPIPIAADESAQGLPDIAALVGRFNAVNIKLDKCGGMTEALRMAQRAKQLKLSPMVGCMFGTSLAMAPGFIVGQLCQIVDLDGTVSLSVDRMPRVDYVDGTINCPPELWGGPG